MLPKCSCNVSSYTVNMYFVKCANKLFHIYIQYQVYRMCSRVHVRLRRRAGRSARCPAGPRPACAGGSGRGAPQLAALLSVMRQTLQGSFSAVSKRNFARKYALESSGRDLHNALVCTALKSHFLKKMLENLFVKKL